MPLPIHTLQSATASVYRRVVSLTPNLEAGGIWITAWTRHHATLSSDRQYISTQPKIHMSLPDKHTVHSSIPLRPTLTFALPPKPNFAVELPVHHKSRSSDVEPQSYRPSVRHSRDDDSYRSRSPPRREHDTYISSSSSRSWCDTDSYRAHSRSPRRETDRYIPRSPIRRETDRYEPDRSPPPRRATIGRYSPVDDRAPLRTWTDSYRPDKLVQRRDYSTSLSRSPEKRSRRLSTPDSSRRSRSVSSQRKQQPAKETSTRREGAGKASKEQAISQERPRSVHCPHMLSSANCVVSIPRSGPLHQSLRSDLPKSPEHQTNPPSHSHNSGNPLSQLPQALV